MRQSGEQSGFAANLQIGVQNLNACIIAPEPFEKVIEVLDGKLLKIEASTAVGSHNSGVVDRDSTGDLRMQSGHADHVMLFDRHQFDANTLARLKIIK